MGLTAQLSVTATTLPTHGIHQQTLPRVSETSAVKPHHPAQPRTAAAAAQPKRVVRITTPKKSSPKVQEKPLPQLLPPLPGKANQLATLLNNYKTTSITERVKLGISI